MYVDIKSWNGCERNFTRITNSRHKYTRAFKKRGILNEYDQYRLDTLKTSQNSRAFIKFSPTSVI